ncbi:MAG: serine hydrolase [Thermoanaerobaculia bacterium]
MRRTFLTAASLLYISCATAVPTEDVGQRIDAIIQRHPAQTIAVSYYDFATGRELHRNEKVHFHAASTMKTPVMLGIFEAVSRGELRLDQPVKVKNDFVSILDGSRYSLEAREDSDAELYDHIGQELPLRELVRRMITRSSNLATNIVIEFIGAPRVMVLMKQIGATDIKVLRGVEDDKAYRAGMNNTTTSHDLMLIMRTLGEQKAISPEASREMIEILSAQEHNDGIPSGLPKGTKVAHKTGSITAISHDAALVIPADRTSYVLVVLTRGFRKGDDADAVIRAISSAVWSWR